MVSFFILSFAALCVAPPLRAQLDFDEVSQAVHINANMINSADHEVGPMNGGASIGDFNNDGICDIFLPSTGISPDRIFMGKPDHTFLKVVPILHNATQLHRGVGSTVGDFDGDGWQDIYVTSFGDMGDIPGPGANRLYRNNQDGSFTEVAEFAGVAFDAPSIPDGFGACFGDYDLDGDLDLFVCGWNVADQGNQLFRNEGNGTFVNRTHLANFNFGLVRGFSPRFADMNGDRYPDLLLASDFGTTMIFQNERNGTFLDVTQALAPDKAHYGMGQALADFNGDGLLDWYVTSIFFDNPNLFIPNGNRLYLNQGPGLPMKGQRFSSGVVNGGWGWGTVAGDFDLDGDMDLAEVNGWEDPEWVGESSFLFLNDGDANFTDEAASTGFADFGQGRGLVSFDYQNDGDLDLLVVNNNGPVHLYRNNMGGNKHWLRIDVDTSANSALAPDGSGTRIIVQANGGKMVQVMDGGASYLGCSQMTTLFGLGNARTVDRITVEWADGFRTILENIDDNQIIEVAAPAPLIQDANLYRGQNFDTTVRGLIPGETAWFVSSMAGTTLHGPGHPNFGDVTLNLRTPVTLMGSAVAGAHGEATLTSVLPPAFPLTQIATQVVVSRDPNGLGSIKSNVVVRQVQN